MLCVHVQKPDREAPGSLLQVMQVRHNCAAALQEDGMNCCTLAFPDICHIHELSLPGPALDEVCLLHSVLWTLATGAGVSGVN